MFLHGSWMHLIGNMWFLYILGDDVEDYLGHFKYLVFYVLTGLIAMVTQAAVSLHSTVPTLAALGAPRSRSKRLDTGLCRLGLLLAAFMHSASPLLNFAVFERTGFTTIPQVGIEIGDATTLPALSAFGFMLLGFLSHSFPQVTATSSAHRSSSGILRRPF